MSPRIPARTPDLLDDDQRALYDEIVNGPRAQGPQHFALVDETGALRGPFNAMLLAPGLGAALQKLGSAIRFDGILDARSRELAILVVAGHWRSDFEREAHEAVGRAAGLSDDELAAAAIGDETPFHGAERVVARVARELAAGDLDDDTWTDAVSTLGIAAVYELTVLVGYYATLALQLRAFRV